VDQRQYFVFLCAKDKPIRVLPQRDRDNRFQGEWHAYPFGPFLDRSTDKPIVSKFNLASTNREVRVGKLCVFPVEVIIVKD